MTTKPSLWPSRAAPAAAVVRSWAELRKRLGVAERAAEMGWAPDATWECPAPCVLATKISFPSSVELNPSPHASSGHARHSLDTFEVAADARLGEQNIRPLGQAHPAAGERHVRAAARQDQRQPTLFSSLSLASRIRSFSTRSLIVISHLRRSGDHPVVL